MNAIEMLKQDHAKVKKLLKQLTESDDSEEKKAKLLKQIHQELEIHTRLEEDIFYPAFRDAKVKEGEELYHESLEEHHIVEDTVIPDVEKVSPGSGEFAGRAKVLRELVEHHASDEEEEMFPKAKKALSKEELEDLGKRMEVRRKELKQQLGA